VNRRIGSTGIPPGRLLTLWLSAALAAAAAWGVRFVAPVNRPLLVGGAVILVYGAVYLTSTAVAGVEEVDDILGKVRRRFKRR
jgi:putative peptidoglycan lipid II flippase